MHLARRRLVHNQLRWLALVAAYLLFLRIGLAAFGGKALLWAFAPMMQSRFTSMAMLAGTLRLRNGIQHAVMDEQIYNGAAYTNWGFGIPLLQVPFHAVAHCLPALFPSRFFPDRTIFFVYFALTFAVLWAGLDRLLALRGVAATSKGRRHLLSWSGALLASSTLYAVMSGRFMIYEETLSYFGLFELMALGAYLLALDTWRTAAVCAIGAAAGMALLIRPSGVPYVALWGFLVAATSRRKSTFAIFVAALGPFVVFWLWSNVVRTGSPFDFGIQNSSSCCAYHTPRMRFGNQCSDTVEHLLQGVSRLFQALFVQEPDGPSPAWISKCHFDLEARHPDQASNSKDAVLGPVVLVLLVWMVATYVARRERRLSPYAPIAIVVALFAAYVRAGSFSARYVGDFWPAVAVACVEYVRTLPTAANRWFGLRLAFTMLAASGIWYARQVIPVVPAVDAPVTADDATVARMWHDFEDAHNTMDSSFPSKLSCTGFPTWPIYNGRGWHQGKCDVDTSTNIFLSVPGGGGSRYTIRFDVEHAALAPLRVYANGRVYDTHTEGNSYLAYVDINPAKLVSPIIEVTIQWVLVTDDPPPIKLMSVEMTSGETHVASVNPS